MKKVVLVFLLFSFSWANSLLNIARFGSTRVVTHPNYPMPLVISVPGGDMNIMAESSSSQEVDAPVELHQMAGVSIESSSTIIPLASTTPPQIIIAVIDSGIDLNNEQLKPYLFVNPLEIPNNGIDDDHNGYIDDVNGVNLFTQNGNVADDLGHGTLMASIIAQTSKGHVKILPIKIFDAQGRSSQFLVSCALAYAKQMGASVANCSFGYDATTEVLRQEVLDVQSRGMVIVASAGNQGQERTVYPAAFQNVIAVASLDGNDHLANFSNYGAYLSVSTIGVGVLGFYPGNQVANASGTSVSAAYISGLLGLMSSKQQKQPSRENMTEYIVDIRDPLGTGANFVGWDKYSGDGKFDITDVSSSQNTTLNASLIVGPVLSYPNPIRTYATAQIGFELSQPSNVSIKLYDLAGRLRWSDEINASNTLAGYNKIPVDGKDNFGNWLENDTYLVLVTADDHGQKAIARHRLTVIR